MGHYTVMHPIVLLFPFFPFIFFFFCSGTVLASADETGEGFTNFQLFVSFLGGESDLFYPILKKFRLALSSDLPLKTLLGQI